MSTMPPMPPRALLMPCAISSSPSTTRSRNLAKSTLGAPPSTRVVMPLAIAASVKSAHFCFCATGPYYRDDIIVPRGTANVRLTTLERARPRQPWLAGLVSQLFLRRLPRSPAHGMGSAARHQRGSRAGGAGLRHAWSPGHGDHQLRARRRARSQGLDGQRLDDSAG